MPGPYDYTINIPQPPAQNFLQSLLGIQQLKGLQQQSQLAEQQAAIQQQQAAFQQQMQPLQLEAERARIGQIGTSTAAAQEALRGARIQNEQAQRQNDFQKELISFTEKPVDQWSESEVRTLAARGAAIDPAKTKGVIDFWASQPKPEKNLVDETAMKAGIAIAQGRPDIAKSIVDQAKSDAEKLGFQIASKFLDFGGSQLEQDPAYAYATILGHFATDKAKLDQLVTASELKGKMSETQAKSELQQAQAGLAKVDTELKQLKATGKLDSEEAMKQETLMRDNFQAQPLVRNFLIRQDNYDIIKTADKSPEGDRARITAFIKLHDPNSVVSVTESGQITSTTPVAQYQSWIAKFNNDGILGDTVRKSIDSQADKTIKSAESQFNAFKNNTAAIAKRYGINPKNVVEVFDRTQTEQPTPTAGSTSAPAPTSTDKITGTPDLTMPPAGAVRRIK